jgi:hypothetical protein
MPQVKICPDCGAEYFPHIEHCADCAVPLLLPEEHKRVQEERKQCREKTLESPVVVKEGDLNWLDELYNVLIDSSIPSVIHADTNCKKGCSGHPYQLLVSASDAEKANELIEEHYVKVHPEFRESRERITEGKCPACRSPVQPDTVECPDCGLTLLIIEE